MRERVKAITTLPGWLERLEHSDKLSGPAMAYQVPLVFRAVNLRCNSLAKVPVHITRNGKEAKWPFPAPLKRLLWKTEASMLLAGAAYWLKITNGSGTVLRTVQWLNPFTMALKASQDEDGAVSMVFEQNTDRQRTYAAERMVYMAAFNPLDDLGAGISSTDASLQSAQLMHYLTRFAGIFFESGAMPVVALGVEQASPAEVEKLQNWFRRTMSGIKNAWRVLAFGGKLQATVLTPSIKDMAIPDLRDQAIEDISWGFGVPKTMLSDAANFATASQDYQGFLTETVQPEAEMIEEEINQQLLNPLGYELEFAMDEMGALQKDEADRSGALVNLVQAGVPLADAMAMLGYEAVSQEGPGRENQTNMGSDMEKWQRKALKRLEQGKRAACAFESETISGALSEAILAGLEVAETAQDVRVIFADAQTWRGYP